MEDERRQQQSGESWRHGSETDARPVPVPGPAPRVPSPQTVVTAARGRRRDRRDHGGMPRSATSSRERRPTGIILGLLVAFIIATVGLFVLSQGGDGTSGVDSGSADSKKGSSTTAPTTTTTTRSPIDYTVKPGDALTAIAKQFGVSTTAIVDANKIPDPDRLVEGQVLRIPSPTPVNLVIRPAQARTGGSVEIQLTGAERSELVSFVIVSPVGMYSGAAHLPDAKGSVTTSYRLGPGDPPGTYTVTARGDQVTEAEATFRVVAATP